RERLGDAAITAPAAPAAPNGPHPIRALAAGGAALSAEVRHLDRFVRLGELPTPVALRLSLSAEASPALRLQLELAEDAAARAMAAALPVLLARLRDQLRLLGLGGLLSGLAVASRGRDVTVSGLLPPGDVALLLGLIALRLQLLPIPKEAQ